jgi:archaeosine-15-forming tRNA-guanine transglycosylase
MGSNPIMRVIININIKIWDVAKSGKAVNFGFMIMGSNPIIPKNSLLA